MKLLFSFQSWTFNHLLMICVSLFLSVQSNAQLPCNGATSECVDYPWYASTYKCITGYVYLSELLPPATSLLLSQQVATWQPQNLVIKGTLVVDIPTSSGGYTFSQYSDIVLINQVDLDQPNIIINPDCKLVLDRVSVHGCNSMWGSITALPGSTLVVKNNSQIKDGDKAILVKTTPSSSPHVFITDSYFSANNISLYFEGNISCTGSHVVDAEIYGNIIEGDTPLKTPFSGAGPKNGIRTIGVSMSIGKSGFNSNVIRNFNIGSGAKSGLYGDCRSNLAVLNTKISGIKEATGLGRGIYMVGPHGSIKLTGSSPSYTIEDCDAGIYLLSAHSDIDNVKIRKVKYGINKPDIIGGFKTRLIVKNSTFEEFKIAIYAGVPFRAYEIDNCIFDNNSTTSLDNIEDFRAGIATQPVYPTDCSVMKITNNRVVVV